MLSKMVSNMRDPPTTPRESDLVVAFRDGSGDALGDVDRARRDVRGIVREVERRLIRSRLHAKAVIVGRRGRVEGGGEVREGLAKKKKAAERSARARTIENCRKRENRLLADCK